MSDDDLARAVVELRQSAQYMRARRTPSRSLLALAEHHEQLANAYDAARSRLSPRSYSMTPPTHRRDSRNG